MNEFIDQHYCAEYLSRENNLGPIQLRRTGYSSEYNVLREGALIGTVTISTREDEQERTQVLIGQYVPC